MRVICGNIDKEDRYSHLPPFEQLDLFDLWCHSEDTYTNSAYILNYLNLCIMRYDKHISKTNCINYDDLEVYYQQKDGEKIDLKSQNNRLINTNIMSECINWIYDEYKKIKEITK